MSVRSFWLTVSRISISWRTTNSTIGTQKSHSIQKTPVVEARVPVHKTQLAAELRLVFKTSFSFSTCQRVMVDISTSDDFSLRFFPKSINSSSMEHLGLEKTWKEKVLTWPLRAGRLKKLIFKTVLSRLEIWKTVFWPSWWNSSNLFSASYVAGWSERRSSNLLRNLRLSL